MKKMGPHSCLSPISPLEEGQGAILNAIVMSRGCLQNGPGLFF